ncbi:MAG: serine hydrolase [Clostridia bacterium]|nr:serine hydrolase [Clostridia bacterium]
MKKRFLTLIIVITILGVAGILVLQTALPNTEDVAEKPMAIETIAEEPAAVSEPEPEPVIDYEEEKIKLTEKINSIISNKRGEWSVYVKNLKTGMAVEINNKEFIAASVIKLYNMITLYDEINKGNMEMTDILQSNLEQMITVSSNSASNFIVTQIGSGNFDKGAKIVTACVENMGCTGTYEQHELFSDHIPPNKINRTSVRDCGLVLEKIYLKQCVSEQYDTEMLELLKKQTRTYKISGKLPDEVVVANKTGENSNVEADVGIVFSPQCDYIICISAERFGETSPIDTISEVSKCVYDFFNE